MKKLHGWQTATISDIADIGGGSGFPEIHQGNTIGDYPFIKVSDLNLPGNEKHVRIANNWINEDLRKKIKAKLQPEGAIVFAKVGGALLTNKRRILTRSTIIDNNMMSLTATNSHPGFLYQVMLSIDLGRYRQEGAVPSVNGSRVGEIVLDLPPLTEQRKIADILSTWDEALETHDALISAKERQKQALMQQLLTGKTRVKGAKGKWKKVRFADWLTESRIPGTDGSNAKKITIKLYGRGVYPKQDRLAGSENTKYYIRKSGQFIYSKLDFLNGAFGIVPKNLDGYESTLDLPSFDINPSACAQWLLYYVTRPEFYTQQHGAAAGGRKARRVNPSEFLAMKIYAPDLSEQQQIAAILDTADQELTLLRTQRQTLDQQKRGLMQQLLTGKVRVTSEK